MDTPKSNESNDNNNAEQTSANAQQDSSESPSQSFEISVDMINKCIQIMRKQFPNTRGLQDLTTEKSCELSNIKDELFVQILSFNNRWIVVSNVHSVNKERDVKVYDS